MTYVGEIALAYGPYRRLQLGAARRTMLQLAAIITAVMAVVGAVQGGVLGVLSTIVAAVIVCAVIGYPGLELLIWVNWRRARPSTGTVARYEVGPTVSFVTDDTRMDFQLEALRSARAFRDGWFLQFRGNSVALVVPRAAFSYEDAIAIDALLLREVKLAGKS